MQSLSRLFKLEFMFRADAPFDQIFDDTLADMIAAGELAEAGDTVTFGPGHDGLDGRGWITFHAALVRNFVESYRIAARTTWALTKGALPEKDLVARALRAGEQMFLSGEIERSEAVNRPALENAFAAFLEQGYLRREDGKLALSESFASGGDRDGHRRQGRELSPPPQRRGELVTAGNWQRGHRATRFEAPGIQP